RLLLCATSVFSVSLLLIFTTEAQRTQRWHREEAVQGTDFLPPPKPTLVAIHFPDLSKLGTDVRDQITLQQDSLAATVKVPAVNNANLSEAYGEMGEVYHAYSLTSPARE